MKLQLRKYSIFLGIGSTIVITILFWFSHRLIPSGLNDSTWLFVDSVIRVAFSIPCFMMLGFIIKNSGYKFAFTTKGFLKGIFACSAILLFMLTMILKFTMMAELNTAFIPKIPAVLAQQITTGLFEESLYRGVLITALIIKWGNTARGRVAVIIMSGIVFGAVHLQGILNGQDVTAVLMNALGAGLLGVGYSAVYLYSGNLLCCMFIHAVYDIAVHMSSGLISSVWGGTLYRILNIAQPILLYAVIPLFAVALAIRSRPLVASGTEKPNWERET